MKKILLLAIVTLIMSKNAFSVQNGECGTGCTYILEDGVLTVTGTGENAGIKASAFRSNSSIEHVIIQGTITYIGTDAFIGSGNMKTIDMSNAQIKTIGTYAFEKTGLEKITIPPSVTSIDRDAFHLTNALKEMVITADMINSISFKSHDKDWRETNYGLVVCKDCSAEQVQLLTTKLNSVSATTKGIQIHENDADGNTLIKDLNGNYVSGFDAKGNKLDVDLKGRITASYDKDGIRLKSYIYGDDGSVLTYNQNGKLIAAQGKRIFTVEEATSLVGKMNTFKIRYR